MARRRSQAIRKPHETPEQVERRIVRERTDAIGLTLAVVEEPKHPELSRDPGVRRDQIALIERQRKAREIEYANFGKPAATALHLVPVTAQIERGGERGGGKTVRRLDEIGKLMRQHLLTSRQFAAAERYQELYQVGGMNAGRAQDYGACGGGSSSVPCLIPDSMRAVAARRQLDLIRTYLAPNDEKLLIRVCVLGESIGGRVTGAERARHVNALAWLCKALDRVASAVRL